MCLGGTDRRSSGRARGVQVERVWGELLGRIGRRVNMGRHTLRVDGLKASLRAAREEGSDGQGEKGELVISGTRE